MAKEKTRDKLPDEVYTVTVDVTDDRWLNPTIKPSVYTNKYDIIIDTLESISNSDSSKYIGNKKYFYFYDIQSAEYVIDTICKYNPDITKNDIMHYCVISEFEDYCVAII